MYPGGSSYTADRIRELTRAPDNYYDGSLDPYSDQTGILRAVFGKDLQTVKDLVADGVSVNTSDIRGNTPLHVAVVAKSDDIAKFLLSWEGIGINIRNERGASPLFTAVERRNADMVRLLIDANADVNLPIDKTGETPLHVCATAKCPELGRILLQHGANVNALGGTLRCHTPLHEAVIKDCLETVRMLIEYNADVNILSSTIDSQTPFTLALLHRRNDIQKLLLDHVKDFNIHTRNEYSTLGLALMYASPYVEDIIRRGADINYVHPEYNSFILCVDHPNIRHFQLIWEKFEFQKILDRRRNYLHTMTKEIDDDNEFVGYLNIILSSENIRPIVKSLDAPNNCMNLFVNRCQDCNFPLEDLTKFVIWMCYYGYKPIGTLLDTIYRHHGYCELFQFLLSRDIDVNQIMVSPGISKIIYDVSIRVNEFMERVTEILDDLERTGYTFDYSFCCGIFKFIACPRLISRIKCKFYNRFQIKNTLPGVPLLLEIARNSFRDTVIEKNKFHRSYEYFRYLDSLNIPSPLKDVLEFKKELYTINIIINNVEDQMNIS